MNYPSTIITVDDDRLDIILAGIHFERNSIDPDDKDRHALLDDFSKQITKAKQRIRDKEPEYYAKKGLRRSHE